MQKRSDWYYNGKVWVHSNGRYLTRPAGYEPQAASSKPRKCKNCSKPVDSFYHLNPLLCNETNNKPQAASNKRLDKVK